MIENNCLTISEFSRRCGISRFNLIYYDNEGILIPAMRKDNNYRLYTLDQLDQAYVISTLRKLDMSLNEIRNYLETRTPEETENVFSKRITLIDEKIKDLMMRREILSGYLTFISEYRTLPVPLIRIVDREAETIEYGPLIENPEKKLTTIAGFCITMLENGEKYINHVGKMYTKENILNHTKMVPDRFYFRRSSGSSKKEKGTFLEMTEYSDGSNLDELYEKMKQILRDQHLTLVGETYEEFIFDEICVQEKNKYVVRIAMHVQPDDEQV